MEGTTPEFEEISLNCEINSFMEQINQNEKTLVFCATQEHALAG